MICSHPHFLGFKFFSFKILKRFINSGITCSLPMSVHDMCGLKMISFKIFFSKLIPISSVKIFPPYEYLDCEYQEFCIYVHQLEFFQVSDKPLS